MTVCENRCYWLAGKVQRCVGLHRSNLQTMRQTRLEKLHLRLGNLHHKPTSELKKTRWTYWCALDYSPAA
ncbi:hypothetical protein ATANTOWER_029796 [Ataeniobius toweri]|uniref:Uncharacterized protein n=1 Tax=Ataeniobius toweri TaxID=208326 RepID=A0ABU7CGE3_9TELE|nr:hypothetical protein [Ataeniobius toweri]